MWVPSRTDAPAHRLRSIARTAGARKRMSARARRPRPGEGGGTQGVKCRTSLPTARPPYSALQVRDCRAAAPTSHLARYAARAAAMTPGPRFRKRPRPWLLGGGLAVVLAFAAGCGLRSHGQAPARPAVIASAVPHDPEGVVGLA